MSRKPLPCGDCGHEQRWLQLFTSAGWFCDNCEGNNPIDTFLGSKAVQILKYEGPAKKRFVFSSLDAVSKAHPVSGRLLCQGNHPNLYQGPGHVFCYDCGDKVVV